MPLLSYDGNRPRLGSGALVCKGAHLIGRVTVGDRVSIWFNAVVRGDLAPIEIGAESNIQDGAVLHIDMDVPLIVGRRVTVGHGAVLHSCRVGDGALIGMGAVVLSGAEVGEEAVVAAGALVPENASIPPRSLSMGVPARVIRDLTEDELVRVRQGVDHYLELAEKYSGGRRG